MANTLAFQLYTLKEYEGGWDAAFEAVKQLGINTIEIWSGAVPHNPENTTSVDGLRAALTRASMQLRCGHVAITEFDSRYEAWRDLLRDFGSQHWVIPFAKAETLEEWLGLLPKFREMADRLAQDGLALGYHNHHMELIKLGDNYVFEHLLDNMPELKAQFHIGRSDSKRLTVRLPDRPTVPSSDCLLSSAF